MHKKRMVFISLTSVISVGFLLLTVFCFRTSYLRFFESVIDLGRSVKYFFCELFRIENTTPVSVIERSKVIIWESILPEDLEGFQGQTTSYFTLLFDKENFCLWLKRLGVVAGDFARILIVLLPLLMLLFMLIKRIYESTNNNYNMDTKPLICFKWLAEHTYRPAKGFIQDYVNFLRENGWTYKTWIALWVFNFNFATIIMAFFAFYFYFAMSYDFVNIYVQFVKLFMDLQVFFKVIPAWALLFLGYPIFHHWRKSWARKRLNHFEARNCGFINELPIVSMSCGSMGKKKTTLITDMALSQEVMFRQKALEILQKADMKFPNFPWICFEKELCACMEHHAVYNLASTKTWVGLKRLRFEKHGDFSRQLYGYDGIRYGMEFQDGLRVSHLFDVLETYAQAYFIYVVESSLLLSNYAIRTDNTMYSEGNFPVWSLNFFPERITEGRHAHILDFDVLRLGKKVIENNPKAGSFEFGVVAITEIGKERGNNLELREVKKSTEETNQKNDLFNAWLKMCRHSATVDNFPFIKVFTDEQRPESWGADARDLCDVIHVASSGDEKLALPFYTIEEMITEWCFNKFMGLYTDFRYRRGDNTLLVYLLKGITAALWRRNIRIYNHYGYSILRLEKERGTMDGKVEHKKYFLMNQKIYARRFSTDCFSDYFHDLAKGTNVGLNDYMEYTTEKATVEELKMQNSYFINGLYGK